MSDKNEFARCVPAMFQESAVNWLLDKLSADMEEYKSLCERNMTSAITPKPMIRCAAARARLVRETLLCLHSDSPEICEYMADRAFGASDFGSAS